MPHEFFIICLQTLKRHKEETLNLTKSSRTVIAPGPVEYSSSPSLMHTVPGSISRVRTAWATPRDSKIQQWYPSREWRLVGRIGCWSANSREKSSGFSSPSLDTKPGSRLITWVRGTPWSVSRTILFVVAFLSRCTFGLSPLENISCNNLPVHTAPMVHRYQIHCMSICSYSPNGTSLTDMSLCSYSATDVDTESNKIFFKFTKIPIKKRLIREIKAENEKRNSWWKINTESGRMYSVKGAGMRDVPRLTTVCTVVSPELAVQFPGCLRQLPRHCSGNYLCQSAEQWPKKIKMFWKDRCQCVNDKSFYRISLTI